MPLLGMTIIGGKKIFYFLLKYFDSRMLITTVLTSRLNITEKSICVEIEERGERGREGREGGEGEVGERQRGRRGREKEWEKGKKR